MKFSLRVTLTTILLGVILVTVAALGYYSYRNARFTADDLTRQVLEQTSLRVDYQLNDLLREANEQSALNLALLHKGPFDVHSFPPLAVYWLDVMKVQPRLTRLSLGLEDTGEWFYVRRRPDGKLAVGELRKNPQTGKLRLRDYWPEDYPNGKPFSEHADAGDEDPRTRPWYVAAKTARRQTWSETYVFFGTEGFADVPGATCATPIYRADGSLVGVLGASFALSELCGYLQELHVGQNGYAFVVEFRADGSRQVIAHPNQEILLRAVRGPGKEDRRELVPIEELADRRVPAFLKSCNLPADFHPSSLKGMKRVEFRHDGVSYLGSYQCLSRDDTPDWLICTVIPEADVLERVYRNNRNTILIGLAVLLVAVLISLYFSRRVARKMELLAQETEAIGRLEVEPLPIVHSWVREVHHLAVALEQSKTSLRSFQKYVPAELVRVLLSSGQEATLGGESGHVTVYFCDLADFTSVSEKMSPHQLVQHLSDYFGTFSAQILASGGTVDKYVGDAIMAFWGAPLPHLRPALAACTTAIRNQQSLKELRDRWQAEGKPLLFARIGIHQGEVVVGNIGSARRLNYTVMGDAVNLASRLEGLNKYYGTETLISVNVYSEVLSAVVARPVDWVSVKGRTEPVLIYELLALKGEGPADGEELAELAARALERYRGRDWAGAIQVFEELLRLRPGDGPARLLLARCLDYQQSPPPEDWDGVHRMEKK